MYERQSLELQFLGSPFVIFSLKLFKVALILISVGTMFHTFELNTLRGVQTILTCISRTSEKFGL